MPVIPPGLLQWRKTTGAEQWDAMWQGGLHRVPASNFIHQQLESDIESWLRQNWATPLGCKVNHQINIAMPGGWPSDEAWEKLDFDARLGVPEVWIIHRDTRIPEVFTLTTHQPQPRYTVALPDQVGWLRSQVTQVRLKGAPGHRLLMQMDDNDST